MPKFARTCGPRSLHLNPEQETGEISPLYRVFRIFELLTIVIPLHSLKRCIPMTTPDSDSLRIGYESESLEVGRSQKGESRHDYLV